MGRYNLLRIHESFCCKRTIVSFRSHSHCSKVAAFMCNLRACNLFRCQGIVPQNRFTASTLQSSSIHNQTFTKPLSSNQPSKITTLLVLRSKCLELTLAFQLLQSKCCLLGRRQNDGFHGNFRHVIIHAGSYDTIFVSGCFVVL